MIVMCVISWSKKLRAGVPSSLFFSAQQSDTEDSVWAFEPMVMPEPSREPKSQIVA